MKTERHHILPLSLWGLDVEANIVSLPAHTHRHIHGMLNIPSNEYSSIMRKYRKLFNGSHEVTATMVEFRLNVQARYFSNIDKLAPLAYEAHIRKFNELIWYLEEELVVHPSFEGSDNWDNLWDNYMDAYTNYFLID